MLATNSQWLTLRDGVGIDIAISIIIGDSGNEVTNQESKENIAVPAIIGGQ